MLLNCPNHELSKQQVVQAYRVLLFVTVTIDQFILGIGLSQLHDRPLRFAIAFDLHDPKCTDEMDVNGIAQAIATLYDVIGKMNRDGVNDPKYRAEEIFLMGDASDNKITRE
ncbi:unnamed protein product, partial [Adineta steineri]